MRSGKSFAGKGGEKVNSFVLSPWSPALGFILGIFYLILLAIDMYREND